MLSIFEGREYLLAVILIGVLLGAAVWYVQRSDSRFARSRIVRWLLIWPVILEKDGKSIEQGSRTRSILVLAVILAAIAVLAIIFTPPKGG